VVDKIKVHILDKRTGAKSKNEHQFYLTLVYTIESLLHHMSDQQLVAGISLLLAVNVQACQISAYHFNLVCTMLLLSAITHVNTMISIPDFITKGKTVATYRLIAIFAQLILSGIVLASRLTKTFPSKPSSLAIMPAACFENVNATDGLGFSSFVDFAQNVTTGSTANATANATQIWDNINAATSTQSGLAEYATLMVFVLLAILVIAIDLIELQFEQTFIKIRWFSIVLSALCVMITTGIVWYSVNRYNTLRGGMEIAKWYNVVEKDTWSLSQIIPLLLLGSGAATLMKSIAGKSPWLLCHSLPTISQY
jgi:hypothetical protein